MQRERYDLAEGHLQRAVDASGGHPELRAKLALARIGNGYEADGMRELAQVFESDPLAHGSVGITLAALQLRRSDHAGALATATRLHDERPRNVHVLNLLGAAQLGLGRVPDARASFEAALAIDPDHLPARSNLDEAPGPATDRAPSFSRSGCR